MSLGLLLQKVWLQNSPPIVGDGVYICIESLKYYDKIYDIILKKKKTHLLFLNFPYNLLQMFYNSSFQGFEDPKNNIHMLIILLAYAYFFLGFDFINFVKEF